SSVVEFYRESNVSLVTVQKFMARWLCIETELRSYFTKDLDEEPTPLDPCESITTMYVNGFIVKPATHPLVFEIPAQDYGVTFRPQNVQLISVHLRGHAAVGGDESDIATIDVSQAPNELLLDVQPLAVYNKQSSRRRWCLASADFNCRSRCAVSR